MSLTLKWRIIMKGLLFSTMVLVSTGINAGVTDYMNQAKVFSQEKYATVIKPMAEKSYAYSCDKFTTYVKPAAQQALAYEKSHNYLVSKIAACVIASYLVFRGIKAFYSKMTTKSVGIQPEVIISACAPRNAGVQNPKLAAFMATLKK